MAEDVRQETVEIVIQRIESFLMKETPIEEVIRPDEQARVVLTKRYGNERPYSWEVLHVGSRFDGEKFARLMKKSGKTPRA